MIELWYSFVYGFGSLVIAIFTYNLYRSNPKHESNIYFSSLGLSAFIWVFSEFLYYTFSGKITLLFYLVKYSGICMASYAVLMSTLTTPIKNKIMKHKYIEYYLMIPPLISIILILTFPLNHLFFSGFKEIYAVDGRMRITGIWGPAFLLFHVPYSYIYLITSLIIIFLNIGKSKTKIDRVLNTTLLIAVIVPFLANIMRMFIRHLFPDPTSLAIIFSSTLMTYTLSKYRIFSLEFRREEYVPGAKMEYGKNYLVYSSQSYTYFRALASEQSGLIITTRNPGWIRKSFHVENSPIIWVTEVSREDAIRPERLGFEIEYSAIEFLRENNGGIILLDGLGYIRAFQSFDNVHAFLKDIMDSASLYGATVILNGSDLKVIPDNERMEIETLFEDVRGGERNKGGDVVQVYPNLVKGVKGIYLTSQNPARIGVDEKNSVWITNSGGGYSRDKLSLEVLEILNRKISEGNNLITVGIEHIFQGWSIGKFHAFFKLLVDICAKHRRKLIIAPWNDSIDSKIRKVVEIYL